MAENAAPDTTGAEDAPRDAPASTLGATVAWFLRLLLIYQIVLWTTSVLSGRMQSSDVQPRPNGPQMITNAWREPSELVSVCAS